MRKALGTAVLAWLGFLAVMEIDLRMIRRRYRRALRNDGDAQEGS